MNCPNCGAPLNIAPGGDHFACAYCGSLHFPTPSAEGIILLDEAPEGLECPVCSLPLHRAKFRHWSGYQCSRCRGLLFDLDDFSEIVKYLRASATGPPDQPIPFEPEGLNRAIVCPRCSQRMSTHPYYGPGNFVIDNCMGCSFVWLDYGELIKISGYPGPDRGRPVEADKEERRKKDDDDDDDD